MQSTDAEEPSYDLDELAAAIEKSAFEADFSSFHDYLETIVGFLDKETEKFYQLNNEMWDEIDDEIESGEIVIRDGGTITLPPEFTDYSGELSRISTFKNTLFDSFFLTIYIYLETELLRHCRDLAKRNPQSVVLSDLKGMNGVEKFMTYLTKVQHVEFSTDKSPEWKKIQGFNLLRNCIVHNQGRIDEGFSDRKQLLEFIKKPDSKLEISDLAVFLSKEFCLDALDTIKSFLYAVTHTEVPRTR